MLTKSFYAAALAAVASHHNRPDNSPLIATQKRTFDGERKDKTTLIRDVTSPNPIVYGPKPSRPLKDVRIHNAKNTKYIDADATAVIEEVRSDGVVAWTIGNNGIAANVSANVASISSAIETGVSVLGCILCFGLRDPLLQP